MARDPILGSTEANTWIAACCLVRRHPLATLNLKDFVDFAEHDALDLVTSEPMR